MHRIRHTAIVTDKVYRENPRLDHALFRQRLADVLEVDRLIVIRELMECDELLEACLQQQATLLG